MAGRALMMDGRAIMRGGRALMATAGSPCCCGTGLPCAFTPGACTDCVGGPGCVPNIALAFREIRTRTGGGQIQVSSMEWPMSFCCGDTTNMPYSAAGVYKQTSFFCPNASRATTFSAQGLGPALLATRQWWSNSGPPDCLITQSNAPGYPLVPGCDKGAQEGGIGLVPLINALQHFSGGPATAFDPTWDNVVETHTFIPGSYREYAFQHSQLNGGITIYENVYVRESWGPPVNCVRGPSCPTVGACCCQGNCFGELTQAECLAGQGTWKGPGSRCNGQTCGTACCIPDLGCTFLAPEACHLFGGLSVPNCTQGCPAFGACCIATTGACIQTRQEDCRAPNTFQGLGSNCFNLARPGCPQPLGRCCIPNTSGGYDCFGATQSACAAANGIGWIGGITCAQQPCPQTGGACCLGNGECIQVNSPQLCVNQGGVFMGVGTDCATEPCVRACCLNGGCNPMIIGQCLALGGVSMPQTGCAPDPCFLGACCCGPTGGPFTCSQSTELDCIGNPNCFFFGRGVPCSPNPCNIGPLQFPNFPNAIARPRPMGLILPDGTPVSTAGCSSCGQGQKRTEL